MDVCTAHIYVRNVYISAFYIFNCLWITFKLQRELGLKYSFFFILADNGSWKQTKVYEFQFINISIVTAITWTVCRLITTAAIFVYKWMVLKIKNLFLNFFLVTAYSLTYRLCCKPSWLFLQNSLNACG